jgi:hypothetical protein
LTFVLKIKHNSNNIVLADPIDSEVSWFYVWGGRDYHMSGQGTDNDDKPNVIQRHSKHIEERRQRGEIPTGNIILNPNWKQDYIQLLKEYVNK